MITYDVLTVVFTLYLLNFIYNFLSTLLTSQHILYKKIIKINLSLKNADLLVYNILIYLLLCCILYNIVYLYTNYNFIHIIYKNIYTVHIYLILFRLDIMLIFIIIIIIRSSSSIIWIWICLNIWTLSFYRSRSRLSFRMYIISYLLYMCVYMYYILNIWR